jgi:hypothetical protein
MKVDMQAKVKMLNGEETKFTIADVVVDALMANDETASGMDRVKRYKLAVRVSNGDESFTVEDISLCKEMIDKNKTLTTLAAGQAMLALEGELE